MRPSLAATVAWIMAIILVPNCARQHNVAGTDCKIDEGPCVRTDIPQGVTAIFDIRPKPVKMMSPLLFSLSLTKRNGPMTDASVTLYLTMPGMYMGDHRVVMGHKGGGTYEGNSVIPRCPSGRHIWKASFVIDQSSAGSSAPMTPEFSFEVNRE
ncbi:MAG TPA: hypothetical protein VEI28_04990 [Thermodesulfovibrionales bacterium]|nr:hypothetical protein [Thermodesulfovibrionales bacterium]